MVEIENHLIVIEIETVGGYVEAHNSDEPILNG
jgi:hypothetical protein